MQLQRPHAHSLTVLAVLLAWSLVQHNATAQQGPLRDANGDCLLFPEQSPFKLDVRNLPVHPNSP